jgi:hypothetical protein
MLCSISPFSMAIMDHSATGKTAYYAAINSTHHD